MGVRHLFLVIQRTSYYPLLRHANPHVERKKNESAMYSTGLNGFCTSNYYKALVNRLLLFVPSIPGFYSELLSYNLRVVW